MSNINFIIYEALFRARGLAQKFRPSVIAYKITHKGTLPLRNKTANLAPTDKLHNSRFFDSNLNQEWLNRLFNSPHVPSDFKISGGFDEYNVAFISFKTKITPRLNELLKEIQSIPKIFVDISSITQSESLIVISSNIWYNPKEINNYQWASFFDSVTSILEDKGYDE